MKNTVAFILINIYLIVGMVNNIIIGRNLLLKTIFSFQKKMMFLYIFILLTSILIIFHRSVLGYITYILSIVFIYTSFANEGIGKNGIVVKKGISFFLIHLFWKKIKDIKIIVLNKEVKCNVQCHSDEFIQHYKLEDLSKLKAFIKANELSPEK